MMMMPLIRKFLLRFLKPKNIKLPLTNLLVNVKKPRNDSYLIYVMFLIKLILTNLMNPLLVFPLKKINVDMEKNKEIFLFQINLISFFQINFFFLIIYIF